jgi:uncharacterized protein (TIGR02145 family)
VDKLKAKYNWYTVSDSRGFCPTEWHVPSNTEWLTYSDSIGKHAGAKLKATHGWSNGGNGTKISAFTALTGGWRFHDFSGIGEYAYWLWCS